METAVVALLLMLLLHASAGTSALTTDPSDVTGRHQQRTTSQHDPFPTDHHRTSSAPHPPSLAQLAPSAGGRPSPAGDQGRTSGDWPPDTTQRAGVARGRTAGRGLQTVVICTLLPYDPRWLFSMPRVGEALDVAVGKVLSGAEPLLTGVQLRVDYRDSRCSIDAGIKEAIDAFVTSTVDVFFGPCCDYSAAPVGRQVKYWNIPMVTPGALSSDFAKKDMFSLMTRMGPNFNSLVAFLLTLLGQFKWRRVLLMYDSMGQSDIVERFCHVAANGIHYGLRTQTIMPHIHQDHFKVSGSDSQSVLRQKLVAKIGTKFATDTSLSVEVRHDLL